MADALTVAQEYLGHRSRLGNMYWLMDTFRFRGMCATTRACVQDMIRKAMERADGSDGRQRYPAFIDTLLARTRNEEILRDQCMNILLASRDTTACSLAWTM